MIFGEQAGATARSVEALKGLLELSAENRSVVGMGRV